MKSQRNFVLRSIAKSLSVDYFGARPHSYLAKKEILYSESDIGVG